MAQCEIGEFPLRQLGEEEVPHDRRGTVFLSVFASHCNTFGRPLFREEVGTERASAQPRFNCLWWQNLFYSTVVLYSAPN